MDYTKEQLENRCRAIASDAAKLNVDAQAAFELAIRDPERAMGPSTLGLTMRIVKTLRSQC